MNKISKTKISVGIIGVALLIALCYGIRAFVQHVNGTSPAQIEARQRAREAAEQSEKAMNENAQWYRDMMSEPVTVTHSDGEEVTYEVKSEPCVNSSMPQTEE